MENDNLTIKEKRELKKQEKLQRKEETQNQQKKNSFFLWTGVSILIIAVVISLIALVKNSPSKNTDQEVSISESVSESDWIKGNRTASTTLIEYADFECPACAQFHPMTKELEREFGDKVKFVFRHFPLSQHVNARLSARAAEAAGVQGKFWEMHDLIFENQPDWAGNGNAREIFRGYASTLGLNLEKFDQDFESREIGKKIEEQLEGGLKYGVFSTPTFFLNDTKLSPRSLEEFKQLIKDEVTIQP